MPELPFNESSAVPIYPRPTGWDILTTWPVELNNKDIPDSCCVEYFPDCGKNLGTFFPIHSGYIKIIPPARLDLTLQYLPSEYVYTDISMTLTILCSHPNSTGFMEKGEGTVGGFDTACNPERLQERWYSDRNSTIPSNTGWRLRHLPSTVVLLALDMDASKRKFQKHPGSLDKETIYVYHLPYYDSTDSHFHILLFSHIVLTSFLFNAFCDDCSLGQICRIG